eukprot:CAMPEP_0168618664 /NCGR_PEP_ID=MMETSP0449_2-20121227/6189_1 /TAXON_ID=1082188 /ORGANISM="Strombidium rassoulzadegani, Strain ras09" /LENGTH=161 /DNA_ID=CAMNT_0008659547 /DNA_START=281 /DNA_END=766 /DNA_ORIENTATION=-
MVEDLGGGDKQLFDVLARLGRGLKAKHDALFALEVLHAVLSHLPLLLQVLLVAHEEDDDVGFALGHDLLVPRIEALEGLQPRDVVGQEDAVGATVEDLGDALELLLAGRVPNLELEDPLFELDEQRAELDAYSDLVIRHEFIICESVKQAGLSHRSVAYYY